MGRFERVLEVGQRLHELPSRLARSDTLLIPRAQMAYEAGEQPFDSAYCLEREVSDRMPDLVQRPGELLSRERHQIDMRHDELDTFYVLIERVALRREEARTAPRFVSRQHDEPYEKGEQDEYRDKTRHGYERVERRAKRESSTRSPNFCVASFKRFCTVLLSSLMNGCSSSTWSRK